MHTTYYIVAASVYSMGYIRIFVKAMERIGKDVGCDWNIRHSEM